MDFSLRVTPEILVERADDCWRILRKIEKHFQNIEEIYSGTRTYWHGTVGDKGRDGFASYKDDVDFILQRLYKRPEELLNMANVYKKVESTVSQTSNQLITDMIV